MVRSFWKGVKRMKKDEPVVAMPSQEMIDLSKKMAKDERIREIKRDRHEHRFEIYHTALSAIAIVISLIALIVSILTFCLQVKSFQQSTDAVTQTETSQAKTDDTQPKSDLG